MSFLEPFDEALIEHYRPRPRWPRYAALVRRAARAGDDRARYAIATWYLHGQANIGVRRNRRVARRWLELAARSSALAMFDLAFAHETGQLGLRKSERTAYRWYVRSAEYGSISALHEVGRCLFHGIGVAPDRTKARPILAAARRQGARD